jgi:hypothetical protein
MRPTTISLTDVGTSAWVPVDYRQAPFEVSLGVVVNGTITYTIEHTFDNVLQAGVTPTAFPHATLASQSANKDGTYTAPVMAIRINNTVGTGTTTLTILQGTR